MSGQPSTSAAALAKSKNCDGAAHQVSDLNEARKKMIASQAYLLGVQLAVVENQRLSLQFQQQKMAEHLEMLDQQRNDLETIRNTFQAEHEAILAQLQAAMTVEHAGPNGEATTQGGAENEDVDVEGPTAVASQYSVDDDVQIYIEEIETIVVD